MKLKKEKIRKIIGRVKIEKLSNISSAVLQKRSN